MLPVPPGWVTQAAWFAGVGDGPGVRVTVGVAEGVDRLLRMMISSSVSFTCTGMVTAAGSVRSKRNSCRSTAACCTVRKRIRASVPEPVGPGGVEPVLAQPKRMMPESLIAGGQKITLPVAPMNPPSDTETSCRAMVSYRI